MAQFDVYTNPMVDQRSRIPYWLDLQSDHIAQLGSRVIIPLRTLSTSIAAQRHDLITALDYLISGF
jgi:hypothetical protein